MAKPLPSVEDGDLVALVQHTIQVRGRDTVRVAKVKGHATDDDVEPGRVRLADKEGNAEADAAADLGRRHPPLLHVRELPEFASLMSMDRSRWPRYLLWHGWLPGLNGTGGRTPWAACCDLERSLGAYPVDESTFWTPPGQWDADDIALEMTDAPMFGLMVAERIFLRVGLRSLALAFFCQLPKLPWLKSMVMLVWSVAVLSCLSLDPSRLSSVLNFGSHHCSAGVLAVSLTY